MLATQGGAVDKVGVTTGWTRGTVSATCAALPVYSAPNTLDHVTLCTNRVAGSRAGQGDSGGPVFASPNSNTATIYPVGILIGGENMVVYDPTIGAYYCTTNCAYSYSPWGQIEGHLARYFAP
jgi:hypothetical protein